MSIQQYDTWKDVLLQASDPNIDPQLDKLSEDIANLSDSDALTRLKAQQALSGDPSLGLLVHSHAFDNDVEFLHHLDSIPGRRGGDTIYVALSGLGQRAVHTVVDTQTLFKPIHLQAPKWDILKAIDHGHIKQFEASANTASRNMETYAVHRIAILPPFLTKCVIEANLTDGVDLFFATRQAILDHDAEHETDDSFVYAAEDPNCRNILAFLWAVGQANNNIKAPGATTVTDSNPVNHWAAQLHTLWIKPNTSTTNTDLTDRLAQAIENQTMENRDNRLERTRIHDETHNSFSRLHQRCQRMVLHASATWDRDNRSWEAPHVPCSTAKDFFAAKTSGDALTILLDYLNLDRKKSAQVQPGAVNALHKGKFLWDSRNFPSNLTSTNFTPVGRSPTIDQQSATLLVIQMKQASGKPLSDAEFATLTAQGPTPACDPLELQFSLDIYRHVLQFFFGPHSHPVVTLTKVVRHIERHRDSYHIQHQRDPDFCAKFQFCIDNSINLFLHECYECTDRNHVDDELINLEVESGSVIRGSFIQVLPATYQHRIANPPRSPTDPSNKRRRTGDQTTTPRLRCPNPNQHQSFKLHPSEPWNTFAGKHLQLLPLIGDTKICHHFHVRGSCFDDCNKRNTHNNACLSNHIISQVEAWMSRCRSPNN